MKIISNFKSEKNKTTKNRGKKMKIKQNKRIKTVHTPWFVVGTGFQKFPSHGKLWYDYDGPGLRLGHIVCLKNECQVHFWLGYIIKLFIF